MLLQLHKLIILDKVAFMRAEYLHLAIILFSFIALALVVSMLLIMLSKKGIEKRRKSIAATLEPWIMDIILDSTVDDDQPFLIPDNISLLLQGPLARKVLLRELMKAKKSLSGISGNNIEKLYNQLSLHRISLKRTTSKRWHIKAKGIQELATMNQHTRYGELLELTNDRDAMVRMEAQTAMVRLQGYKGLQFFETLTYPLSEWHQLNLLHLLANQPITPHTKIHHWLNAPNHSVVQFSLKLIAEQHAMEYEAQILACLQHADETVRKEAVLCLGQIPSHTVATELKYQFYKEGNKNIRLCIINEFTRTGSADDHSFLEELVLAEDVDIKLAADKALLFLSKN